MFLINEIILTTVFAISLTVLQLTTVKKFMLYIDPIVYIINNAYKDNKFTAIALKFVHSKWPKTIFC